MKTPIKAAVTASTPNGLWELLENTERQIRETAPSGYIDDAQRLAEREIA